MTATRMRRMDCARSRMGETPLCRVSDWSFRRAWKYFLAVMRDWWISVPRRAKKQTRWTGVEEMRVWMVLRMVMMLVDGG